ncbi:hypothetical protein DSM104299_00988 [Baekduia alba]|uniref:hypothetical protein n=1 Tax=Baekduia alba TaxID=2997333 RepID=UPI002341C651|nr:hypothetical protein [Baekduia alba]WCB92298.1 hypothetical protein DSM104299_00988 [Baekduia alba]
MTNTTDKENHMDLQETSDDRVLDLSERDALAAEFLQVGVADLGRLLVEVGAHSLDKVTVAQAVRLRALAPTAAAEHRAVGGVA